MLKIILLYQFLVRLITLMFKYPQFVIFTFIDLVFASIIDRRLDFIAISVMFNAHSVLYQSLTNSIDRFYQMSSLRSNIPSLTHYTNCYRSNIHYMTCFYAFILIYPHYKVTNSFFGLHFPMMQIIDFILVHS